MEILLPHRRTPNYPLKITFILLKLSILALGFISFVRFGLPSVRHFILHTVPSLWLSFSSWLNPPYLYIILNCIILTIAATSSLHQKLKTEESESNSHDYKAPPPERSYRYQSPPPSELKYQYQIGFQKKPISYEQYSLVPEEPHFTKQIQEDDEDADFISRSNWSPEASCIITAATTTTTMEEKPLVSSRFTHKRYAKASPDAKSSLRIARPKKGETLEYTWKTLTERRHPPLTRHLRKSETWDSSAPSRANADHSSPARNLRKSETMKHRGREDSPASPCLKREPSLSQDELNRRVEAFISKFNMEMRLQRQNSFTSYMEMINRGCH